MGVEHPDKEHASSHTGADKCIPTVVQHAHEHKHRKQIVNRLARIEGHMRATKEMTASGRDCSEILLQIAAIQKALDSAAKLLLKDHLESCVIDAIQKGNQEQVLADLNKALNNYIR